MIKTLISNDCFSRINDKELIIFSLETFFPGYVRVSFFIYTTYTVLTKNKPLSKSGE